MPETRLLSAESAASELGISRATLYAYVSRGLLHAQADPRDPRRRLYNADDIGRLAGSKMRGRKAADIAAGALDWGLPALSSGITLIEVWRALAARRPATLSLCTLLCKEKLLAHPFPIRYIGFGIEDVFVVGYGLDFDERFRNLPYVAVLHPDLVPNAT